MSRTHQPSPTSPSGPRPDVQTLAIIALCLVSAAAAWYLLQQLVLLLRPLCLAIFLSYAFVPLYQRFREKVPGPASYAVMALAVLLILGAIALIVQASIVDLKDELPALLERGRTMADKIEDYLKVHAPGFWAYIDIGEQQETSIIGKLKEWAYSLIDGLANTLAEGVAVAVYLLFFMLESQRFRKRVQSAFPASQAEQFLNVLGRINDSIKRYVEAKVVASIILAVPVTILLWIFDVKFMLLWGILAFFCNFIPYLGSVISISLPVLLSFLMKDNYWQPITLTILLIGVHMASAYLLEPMMIGRAAGLSPLIVVASLVFWGHVWGLIGMLLAVPLTAIVKIALENVEVTRPFARLLGED
jgi:AI-2 transport protein TqsA